MVTPLDPRDREIAQTISTSLRLALDLRGMTGADLARRVAARNGATKKTIYNALNAEQIPKLDNLREWAEILEIPVWALLIPEITRHKELLTPQALKPLVAVIENYIATDPKKREKIERMAQAMRDETDLDK